LKTARQVLVTQSGWDATGWKVDSCGFLAVVGRWSAG
jgi:hypothetical protein